MKTVSKKTNILYWIFTGLFSFLMLGSAIPDIMISPVAVEGMHKGLGYPIFFIPFIGVAKALGVLAILVPGFATIKEWAYAGLMFDLIGATYSIMAVGSPNGSWTFMLLPLLLGTVAYIFYRKKYFPKKRNNLSVDTNNMALRRTA
ncbi:MAG: DoxX family protein [Ferruginibacter sp.]